MARRLAGLFVALVLAGPATARAQSAADLLARGIRATHDLEFDSAAVWLRRAMSRPAPAALSDADRSRAMMYLGATEFFRDRRDSATAVFRRLIVADPRFRPDLLVFPPEVTTLFNEARLGTRAAAAAVPARTDIAGPGDRLVIRLYGSSIHDVTAVVSRYFGGTAGVAVRTLYSGALGDSLEVLWDGRDSSGIPADSGNYILRVASLGQDRRVVRTVEIPLAISSIRRDTVPWPLPPADSLLRPERTTGGGGTRSLVMGLVTAGAAIALPAMVAPDASASAGRYLVAGTATVAGIIGMLRARSPRPIPENVAANQQLRATWQRQADQVRADNEARRREARVTIVASPARVVESR